MSLPKVSIITVCYNSEKTIEQTICSVLRQTYPNIEYIIIDGASTDHTLDIIERYKNRIHLVSEPDSGLYHAMNKGIIRASGEVIGIINSDDWYEDNAVELAVKYLGNDFDMTYGGCMWIYEDGVMQERRCHSLEELRYRFNISHQTVFVRKEIYEKYGIFNQKYNIAADYDLVLRFYECGVRMVEIPANLAFFRKSGISSKNYIENIRQAREVSLCHWDGESLEIKEKIERYSKYREMNSEIKNIMQKPVKNLKNYMETVFPFNRGYVIFGAGSLGIRSWMFLHKNGVFIECFVDNDKEKWGKEYGGLEIKNPEYLINNRKNIIVANLYYKDEICQQLEEMGCKNGIDFVYVEDLVYKV